MQLLVTKVALLPLCFFFTRFGFTAFLVPVLLPEFLLSMYNVASVVLHGVKMTTRSKGIDKSGNFLLSP